MSKNKITSNFVLQRTHIILLTDQNEQCSIFWVLAKFCFFTPKIINLKTEEKFKQIEQTITDYFNQRCCFKCGYLTKKSSKKNILICKFRSCKAKFSCFKNTILKI